MSDMTNTSDEPSVQPPTREQIAEAIWNSDWPEPEPWAEQEQFIKDEWLMNADAVLALFQNGADR
jgi:hypothetical protein